MAITWTAVAGLPDPFETGGFTAFAVSGTDLYAGTPTGKVYISTNCGSEWTAIATGLPWVHSLAVNGSHMFAGTYGSIHVVTNEGSGWTSVESLSLSSPSWTNDVCALAVMGGSVFAGTDEYLYRSTDNGASWTFHTQGLVSDWIWSLAVSGTALLAGTYNGGVYLSTNRGDSWRPVSVGLPQDGSGGPYYPVASLVVCGADLIAGTAQGKGLWRRSLDEILSNTTPQWKMAEIHGLEGATIDALAATDSVLLAGCYYDTGIWRTTDYGTSWVPANVGLANKWVVGLSVIGKNIFAGTDGSGGIYRSTDQGQSWVEANTGLKSWVEGIYFVKTFLAVHDTMIFAATSYGVFCSTNAGASWIERNSGLVLLPTSALAAIGETMFAATNSGVFRSTDLGTSWTIANSGITQDIITCLFAKDSRLFAGTIGGIFVSADSGGSWSPANNGLPFPATSVLSLNGYRFQVGCGDMGWCLCVQVTMGANWRAFNVGLERININDVVSFGGNLFAGSLIRALAKTAFGTDHA